MRFWFKGIVWVPHCVFWWVEWSCYISIWVSVLSK